MLRSSAAPTTPTKRPLTELLATSKRTTEDGIAKKRKLSNSPPQSERLQDKENREIGDCINEISMKVDQTEGFASNIVPSPLSTPTKHSRSNDASPFKATTIPHIFAHAHLVLSTSSPLTSSLPLSGRSDQRDTLLAFLNRRFPSVYAEASTDGSTSTPKLNPRGPGPAALYASGPPGIGKTALLSAVLGEFVNKVEEKEIGEEVRVCMRNCSTVGTGETAWERLGSGLGMDWKQNGTSKLKGKELFEEGLKDGKKYLLILDEIDHLCTSTSTSSPSRTSSAPDLLNALFSLASLPSSPLTLIGIANDLTLKALNLSSIPSPSKLLGKGKAKLDPLTTPTKPINLHFAPYSWQELVKIVHRRLELLSPTYPIEFDQALSAVSPSSSTSTIPKSFPLIDKVALERAAKKVATGTGDVRTILDLVRKSISLVSTSLSTDSLPSLTLETAPKVKMSHMTQALTTSTGLTTAPSLASRLSSLNSNHRFVLVSLLISISRILPLGLDTTDSSSSSTAAITLEDAYKVYREVVGREESLKNVLHNSKDTFGEAVEMVEDLGGFFRVSSSKGGGGSPAKGGARKTPSPVKGRKGGKVSSTMIISMSDSAPVNELVKVLLPSTEGVKEKEDETSRLSRKMLEREMSDQQWKRKLVAMGRDEERRAEEELEGREWERSMKAKAAERGERCD